MGFVLQVCRLVLTKTPAEARPKEGRGREVLNPHLLRRVFCRFASRAFFSLPVCQPVLFALQAFAGSFSCSGNSFSIFVDKRTPASAAYPLRCKSRDTPVPVVEITREAILEVMQRGGGGGGMVRSNLAVFKKQECRLILLLETQMKINESVGVYCWLAISTKLGCCTCYYNHQR